MSMYPRIIKFIGYDPFPEPVTTGEALLAHRRRQGLSRKRLAAIIGIDEGTVLRLERGKPCPSGECGNRVEAFLATILTSARGSFSGS